MLIYLTFCLLDPKELELNFQITLAFSNFKLLKKQMRTVFQTVLLVE